MSALTQDIITNHIDLYFNSILKNSLKYSETYSISFDLNKNRITLKSDLISSELINAIKRDDASNKQHMSKLRSKVELALLGGFRAKNPDISNVNLYTTNPNEILITFSYSESVMNIAEIGILARLAAEYETVNINEICTINPTFAKACRDELFWWELFKVRYPEYYKNREEMNYEGYNPKEVMRGIEYYEKEIKNIVLIEIWGSKVVSIPDTIRIANFYKDYRQTFKYLILEDLWKLAEEHILPILNIKNLDIEIIKKLTITLNITSKRLRETFLANLIKIDQFKLLEELSNWLQSIGKEGLFIEGDLEEILESELDDDPIFYEYLSDKLQRPRTDNRYLYDYVNTDMVGDKIQDYILSQISENVDKQLLLFIATELIKNRDYPSFKRLYIYFKSKWTVLDKDMLINRAENEFERGSERRRFIDLISSY